MKRILTAIILVLALGVIPAHGEETIQVYLTGADWGLEVPGEGLVVNPNATNIQKETARIRALGESNDMYCGGDIVPAEKEGGSGEARLSYIARNKDRMGMSFIETYDKGEFAILEYMRLEFHGVRVDEMNVLICFAHKGSWAFFHLAKKQFTKEDRPLFDRIIDGVRLIERQESDFTSAELIELGLKEKPVETRLIFLPASNWGVEIPDEGFVTDYQMSGKTKDTLKLRAATVVGDLLLTAYIEPAEGEGGSTEARTVYFDRMKEAPMEMSDVKTYERGPFAILEYTHREHEGQVLNQRHLHLYLVHSGSWVDIHLSKVNYTEEDRPHFDLVVARVSLFERRENDLTSAEYKLLGDQAAASGLCEEADANYQVALAINKVKTQMKKEDFVDALLNLGICYGGSGEFEEAISTLQAGIQIDDGEPDLHYNLACAYAELGEEEKAVAALTTAYEKLVAARPLRNTPNPLEDPSFESMKQNPEFKKIAKKIAKENKSIEKELGKSLNKIKRVIGG